MCHRIKSNYLTQNIFHSNDNDSITKPDDSTLCAIDNNLLIQNIFHSNDNDSVTHPDNSTSEDSQTNYIS